jgi:potassium efflux system protein
MQVTATKQTTRKRLFFKRATAALRNGTRLVVQFAKMRPTKIPIRIAWPTVLALSLLLRASPLFAKNIAPLADFTSPNAQAPGARVSLPQTGREVDEAIVRVETRQGEIRPQLAAAKSNRITGPDSAATPDELVEQQELLQRWIIALDQQGHYLRSLKENRQLDQERKLERETWHGFAQPITAATAEHLTDAVSAQQLELRAGQMYLSILEGELTRAAARLKASHKQLRLARDQDEGRASQNSRRQWLLQLAQLREQVEATSIETSEMGRLVTSEALETQRSHLKFLDRKLSAARAQARITREDLESVLTQIGEKRAGIQKDLNDAITADKQIRALRDNAVLQAGAVNAIDLRLAAEVEQARVQTSGLKVESLRAFLQLADYAQTVWEDRFWATEPHSLRELHAKLKQYEQRLEGLRQWKRLMEQSLSAVSDQLLRQALRAEDTSSTAAERAAAGEINKILQERATVHLRSVGALVFTEDLTSRLQTELAGQTARISLAGKANAVLAGAGSVLRRTWNAELYIAEDSVIADGQKVSIPRSITLGKVLIALTIFLLGLLSARGVFGLVHRLGSYWSTQSRPASDVPAKAVAAIVVLVSLLVAMASVRIPWTVFAFMGGALAIGAGFGAQTLINNFISGVILLCERSIRVGDIVEVDDQRGKVMRVGFRHSLVARGDGIEVLVPNSQFLEKKVVNWTLSDDLVRYAVSVGVSYGANPGRVTEIIHRAAAEHPHVMQDPGPNVLLEEFGEKTLLFRLQFWMRLGANVDGGRVRSELRHRINALFEENGVSMTAPQRDLRLDMVHPLEVRMMNSIGGEALRKVRAAESQAVETLTQIAFLDQFARHNRVSDPPEPD